MDIELEYLANLPYAEEAVPEENTDGSVGYRASNPELPGCMSHGDTASEALRNLAEARKLYIQTLLKRGLPIPKPRAITSGLRRATTIIWQALPPIGSKLAEERTLLAEEWTFSGITFDSTRGHGVTPTRSRSSS